MWVCNTLSRMSVPLDAAGFVVLWFGGRASIAWRYQRWQGKLLQNILWVQKRETPDHASILRNSISSSHCSPSVVSKRNTFLVRCSWINDVRLLKQARNNGGLCLNSWFSGWGPGVSSEATTDDASWGRVKLSLSLPYGWLSRCWERLSTCSRSHIC